MRSTSKEKKGVNRLKKALHRRLFEPFSHIHPVFIRDIVITQSNKDSFGEFNDLDSSMLPSGKTKAKETDIELGKRLYAGIQDLADVAYVQHRRDNFFVGDGKEEKKEEESEIMDPEKLNNITRIITSEFFFYPCKNRGPIPQAIFLTLIGELEMLAKNYPENMHLALATFPVLNESKQVHNQMLYIQCGPKPRIDLFAKSIASHEDVEYLNTTTPYYSSGSLGDRHAMIISSFVDEIIKQYCKMPLLDPDFFEIENMLEELHELCFQHPDYGIGFEHADFPETFGTPAFLESLYEFRKKIYKTSPHVFSIIKALDESRDTYVKFIRDISSVDRDESSDIISKSIAITDRVYGGNILCTTAGGIKFCVVVDICLDFQYHVAQHKLLQLIKASIGTSLLPRLVSQMLTSNTTEIESKKYFLTKNKIIIHVDPKFSKLATFSEEERKIISREDMLEANHDKIQVKFSNAVNVMIYAPVKLSVFQPEIDRLIRKNNQLIVDIQEYELHRSMCPVKLEVKTSRTLKVGLFSKLPSAKKSKPPLIKYPEMKR